MQSAMLRGLGEEVGTGALSPPTLIPTGSKFVMATLMPKGSKGEEEDDEDWDVQVVKGDD